MVGPSQPQHGLACFPGYSPSGTAVPRGDLPICLHILWLQEFAASSLLFSHWSVTAPFQDSHQGTRRSFTSIFLLDTEFLFAFMPHNSFQWENPHKCLLPVSLPMHIQSQPFPLNGRGKMGERKWEMKSQL